MSGISRDGAMLSALTAVFILSHAYRTVVAVSADALATDFGASAQALGAAAGAFHIAFALAQPLVGVGLDRYGPRRVVVAAFLVAIVGCVLSIAAVDMTLFLIGQYLIGAGCAPGLLAPMLLISRRFPPDRFAAMSGLVLSVGGVGMLITSTPLAWLIEVSSWRVGFTALALLSAACWVAVILSDDGESTNSALHGQGLGAMLHEFASILRQPYTAGICCLVATTYAAFMALRGLWLGPLLAQRYEFSLIEIGHVMLAVSLTAVVGPVVFGRMDPGAISRRTLITSCSAAYAVLFVVHALGTNAGLDIALFVFNGLFAGFITLQYADVRSAYPAEMTGRALSVFTMAMFSGVAAVQWLSGAAATVAPGLGIDPMQAALLTVSALLALGTLAFWLLPKP